MYFAYFVFVLHWQGRTCPSHQVLVFRGVPATCLIMRLPYPVPPNRFRYIRGWMLPPAVSSHATPAQRGHETPKTLSTLQRIAFPSFPRGQPSRSGCVSSTSIRSICYYGSSLCQCEGAVRTPALVIVAIFHQLHSRKSF